MELEYTGNNLISEVRSALAGIDASQIPDDTISQTSEKIVVPVLNDIGSYTEDDQTQFNNAVEMWTAELSFDAWLTFTRLRDREIETFMDPGSYSEDLQSRTNLTFRALGVSRPPEVPNQVVTIKHDGVKRKVDVTQNRKLQTHRTEGSE